jgi:hypothetical protein
MNPNNMAWFDPASFRKREVVRTRGLLCQLAIGRMDHPGTEVARFLGVSTSSVNRLLVSEEVSDLKKYLNLFQNQRYILF